MTKGDSEEKHRLTLLQVLERRARLSPASAAILSPDGQVLTNERFAHGAASVAAQFRALGYGRGARVALVLENGPEYAAVVTSIAAAVACAPLNPNLAEGVWAETFAHLRIEAVAMVPSANPVAAAAARASGLPVIAIGFDGGLGGGGIRLDGEPRGAPSPDGMPELEDTAFVLATSGTTSRPKVVPLTQLNISHSAENTARALELTAQDTLLGVLPMHHAHGLISGLMSTLASGASVICMPRFDAPGFFDLLQRMRPSWYTAVPAIHQAVLEAAASYPEGCRDHSLRLIRSASAPLPAERFAALSALFGVPIIETFGMTEATSQIASNPLAPGRQKARSVGVAAGPEIAILGDDGAHLPPGQNGEIILRGPNIARGYDDPEATRAAFTQDGWFRTGDLGHLDDEGYLFIVGRLKEVINRGGEKLLPQRIEAVLSQHPHVREAAVFAAPHPRLGEDVAAAIVPADGAEIDQAALRRFAVDSKLLSDSEIPRLFVVTDAIPRTAMGKVQRAQLATAFGLTVERFGAERGSALPETEVETALARIWGEVFNLPYIGVEDDFFRLGGDSLLAVQIAIRIGEAFDIMLTLRSLFEAPTIRELARLVETSTRQTGDTFRLERSAAGFSLQKRVSISQESILDTEAGFAGFPSYTVPLVYYVDGVFDPAAFEKAVKVLIARHETFRSVFKKVAGKWHAIPSASVNIRIPCEDWRWASAEMREGFINSALESEIWEPFEPTRKAPFRIRVLKFSDQRHAIMLVIHHILMDNWTVKTLMEEAFRHYDDIIAGRPVTAEKPEFQFSDFAHWQRKWAEGAEAARQYAFWQKQLMGARSIFPASATADRPVFGTERVEVTLPAAPVAALAEMARGEGGTLFMALLAALKLFLFQQYGRPDIAIATPTANRARPNTRNMLGLITNNAVIRTRIAPDAGIRATFRQVRDAVLNAYAHQELPFEIVTQRLMAEDPEAGCCLSDIYFSVVDHFEPEVEVDGLTLSRMEHAQDNNTPMPVNASRMMFLLKLTGGRVTGSCLFKPGEFSREEAEALIAGYVGVVERCASSLSAPPAPQPADQSATR
ncbi:AMP-binding protein [Rhodobacteraceae bacterium NNCM2]|nr:AMP-binding protein [Coraliihabitans acroporae]